MDEDHLRRRIVEQFSYRGDRADIWRGFDRFLETESFLNLGYSRWYQSHLLGSPQRRLALRVGRTLREHLNGDGTDRTSDGIDRILDVGCGRGGPAIQLADRLGVAVVGIDLVPHNVSRAAENAAATVEDGDSIGAEFVLGDATRLPFAPGTMSGCTAIDALVYVPERDRVLSELATVTDPGGIIVITDPVGTPGLSDAERRRLDAFADAWDMPPLWTRTRYRQAIEDAGFEVLAVEDLTPGSVGRFRKWTALFGIVRSSPADRPLRWLFRRWELDPDTITTQIQHAHRALPSLRHVLFTARRPH